VPRLSAPTKPGFGCILVDGPPPRSAWLRSRRSQWGESVTERGVVDNAIYVDGKRTDNPRTLDETYDLQRERHGLAWIGLYRPTRVVMESVANEFELHRLVVDDAIAAHQRPKLERYGTTTFTVLRTAHYLDSEEQVEFGELHVLTGDGFVITIRHAESPDLAGIRRRLEGNPDMLRLGPEAVLYSILDQVVDEYVPVVAGLQNDIDEIEDELFGGQQGVSRRIYSLTREVIELQRAAQPLLTVVQSLIASFEEDAAHIELQRGMRDVHDHVVRIVERVDAFRALLQNALVVDTTLVGQRQNEELTRLSETSLAQSEEVKRISGWAAILFAPTLVGTIYGMNFVHMPELHWRFGYPLALLAMLACGVILYAVFRRRRWL